MSNYAIGSKSEVVDLNPIYLENFGFESSRELGHYFSPTQENNPLNGGHVIAVNFANYREYLEKGGYLQSSDAYVDDTIDIVDRSKGVLKDAYLRYFTNNSGYASAVERSIYVHEETHMGYEVRFGISDIYERLNTRKLSSYKLRGVTNALVQVSLYEELGCYANEFRSQVESGVEQPFVPMIGLAIGLLEKDEEFDSQFSLLFGQVDRNAVDLEDSRDIQQLASLMMVTSRLDLARQIQEGEVDEQELYEEFVLRLREMLNDPTKAIEMITSDKWADLVDEKLVEAVKKVEEFAK